MAQDYIDLIKEISEVRGSISRRFYIVIKTKEDDDNKIIKIVDGLKSCGNMVEKCDENEIINIFQSCFKKGIAIGS